MRAKRNNWILPVAALLMGGCGPLVKIGDSGPPPTRFTLAMDQSKNTLPPKPFPNIRIEDFDAPAELTSERVAVRVGPQEVRYAKAVRWADRPARLLRQLVSETIKKLSSGNVLGPTQQEIASGLRLTGQLKAFQINSDGNAQAVVTLDIQLIARPCNRIVQHQTFTKTVAANSDAPRDMVLALNHASNSVAAAVATWVVGINEASLDCR